MFKKTLCVLLLVSASQCQGISRATATISTGLIGGLQAFQVGACLSDRYTDANAKVGFFLFNGGLYWMLSSIINSYTPSHRLNKAINHIKDIAHTYPLITQSYSDKLTHHETYSAYINELTSTDSVDESSLDDPSFINHIQDIYHLSDTPIYQAFLDRKSLVKDIDYQIDQLTIAQKDSWPDTPEEKDICILRDIYQDIRTATIRNIKRLRNNRYFASDRAIHYQKKSLNTQKSLIYNQTTA
jgi:hypothetical protein